MACRILRVRRTWPAARCGLVVRLSRQSAGPSPDYGTGGGLYRRRPARRGCAAGRCFPAQFRQTAVLALRHPVFPAGIDPELLYDLAADIFDECPWVVITSDGNVCVAAMGCRVHCRV